MEASADVASYEAGTVLDPDKYPFINTIGIRKEYFDTQWTSDFVIHFTDGRTGIRELTNKDGLSKRAAIEKLVLEYHKSCRVEDRCHGEGRVLRCS